MSFPTLQVRPNEKNPQVLRAHEFLRQSNQLVERNLVNAEGKKMLARMLSKMVNEVKGIYALDEKRVEAGKSAKLMEKLKTTQHVAMSVMEDRFMLADLSRQVQEKKFSVHRKLADIDNLRNSVQIAKADVQREKEKMEKRKISVARATEELNVKSVSILKHLENSEDVAKLRKMEEEKRVLEEEVEGLREQKDRLGEQILTNRATLKAESKKSFQKTVIECAKHYKLCQSLTPKLIKSQKNVELLKEEEEVRRASGSLDETMMFEQSFVMASMEKERAPIINPPASAQSARSALSNHPVFTRAAKEVRAPPAPEVIVEKPSSPPPAPPKKIPAQKIQKPVEHEPEKEPEDEPMEVQEEQENEPQEPEEPEEEENQQNITVNISQMSEEKEQNSENSRELSMETQRLLPAAPEDLEHDEEQMEIENPQKDTSIDPLEQEEEPMEVEEPRENSKKSVAETVLEISAKSKDGAGDLLKDVAARLEDDVGTTTDNFSFNFFGNSNSNGKEAGADEQGSGSENNFDFNFGNIGSGDDASNNNSAFDFFGGAFGANDDGNSNSDPFGFGKSSGEGGGNGDMSFNFNFDGGNNGGDGGEGEGGASGNGGSFFNF